MQIVSDQFVQAMSSMPYIAEITLDGVDTIQGDPIKNIHFGGGANGDSEKIAIGSAVASSVEILLDKNLVAVDFSGREMTVRLGIELDGGVEWLKMGTYRVKDVNGDDDTITVTGMDDMASKLDVEYETLDGFDFMSENGVSSTAFAKAICERRGVAIDIDGLESVMLTNIAPDGYTERKIIGMIAALYGKFARIDRNGTLRFLWYAPVDAKITGDNYYEDGMKIAGYDFTVGWLKCYNDSLAETLIEGDPDAEQGIYFECPWMSENRLAWLWDEMKDFTYRPVTELSFLGDPRLDPGDIIALEDCCGGAYSVPVMSISHEYDGGILTTVTAQGQSKSDSYEGPIQREVKKTLASIVKKQNAIEMSVQSYGKKVSELEDKVGAIEGIDGVYFHVRYSANADGSGMTEAPADNTKYMGTCSTNSKTAPVNYKDYTWVKIGGEDGAPGEPGADGKTQYLHIKYSDDGETFTPSVGNGDPGETLGAWIGTLVDFNQADSLIFDDYTWKKFTDDVDEEIETLTAELNILADRIESEVTAQTQRGDDLEERMTSIEQTSEDLNILVQRIESDGVNQVVTSMGYSFGDSGMHIQRSGSEIENTIDDTGMYVNRSGETMLKANADGVEATDLKARNYLIIGNYCRIEDYSNGSDTKRTGVFWIGGNA